MDARTVSYYSTNAKDVADRYESVQSPLAGYFSTVFSPGGKILDIGCGSGRDMAELTRQGYLAYGIDATPEFVQLAQELHPELTDRVSQGVLPDFEVPFGGNFDGVLCSAVLMHVDTADLLTAALSIKNCLRVNGRLVISIPTHRGDADDQERDTHGRLFKTYSPGYMRLIFERLGFALIDQWENKDAMTRQEVEWVTMDFQLRSAANSRPIDQIEGVLNHDKKSATYKFALFRALAEIATQSPASAEWLSKQTVGLPVQFVAEKWLQYYWPLVESTTFIPQMNGEAPNSGKQITFRKRLSQLVAIYRASGGYIAFRIERNKGQLPGDIRRLLGGVMTDITKAIVQGPVEFSGGALKTGYVFRYEAQTRQILIPSDLWIEFSHLGYWIGQAVILQWAEKASRLAENMEVAEIVGLLLDREDERSTIEARKFFGSLAQLECVWTGVRLREKWDIDHVIPFDLWHNNDMWNLLPASKTANSNKSNKLPSTKLLRNRKDSIIGYWETLRAKNEERFDKEAETLITIPTNNWQNPLYGQLCHAIEVTALQRGVGRWPVVY
jgi:SAM-dependent methyltransferase